jgi:hypothetical protein
MPPSPSFAEDRVDAVALRDDVADGQRCRSLALSRVSEVRHGNREVYQREGVMAPVH